MMMMVVMVMMMMVGLAEDGRKSQGRAQGRFAEM